MPAFFDFVLVVPWEQHTTTRWGLHDWRVRCRITSLAQLIATSNVTPDIGELIVSTPTVLDQIRKLDVKGVFTSAFEVPEKTRAELILARVEEGPPEYESEIYAASEIASAIAFRFPGCTSLHVNSDSVLVEIVRPGSTDSCPQGVAGEVLVTDLLNDAMPILRYRIGDVGVLKPCRCGRVTPALELVGRPEVLGDRMQAFVKAAPPPKEPHQLMIQIDRVRALAFGMNTQRKLLTAHAHDFGVEVYFQDSVPNTLTELAGHHEWLTMAERDAPAS